MQTYLPQLVRKLLFTEHILDRLQIAKSIFETFDSIGDYGKIEGTLRSHFISLVKVCALNPTAKQRDLVLELANFYAENYTDHPFGMPFAA